MKKSKLLCLVPSVAIATSIPFISSCAKHGLLIEDIEDAIFHPIQTEQEVSGTYVDQLKLASKTNLQKELIYRLFAPKEDWFKDNIKKWYDAGVLNIISNITTCNITFDGNDVYASFAGYIDYIFKDDYDSYKKNDVWQVTFIFDKLKVTPSNTEWCLKFELHPDSPFAFGFIEVVLSGERQLPIVIKSLTPADIPNWHHWVKA